MLRQSQSLSQLTDAAAPSQRQSRVTSSITKPGTAAKADRGARNSAQTGLEHDGYSPFKTSYNAYQQQSSQLKASARGRHKDEPATKDQPQAEKPKESTQVQASARGKRAHDDRNDGAGDAGVSHMRKSSSLGDLSKVQSIGEQLIKASQAVPKNNDTTSSHSKRAPPDGVAQAEYLARKRREEEAYYAAAREA